MLLMRHCLSVLRIDAEAVVADMIDLIALGDASFGHGKGQDMHVEVAMEDGKLSIARAVGFRQSRANRCRSCARVTKIALHIFRLEC
jgi:hypothetical protein